MVAKHRRPFFSLTAHTYIALPPTPHPTLTQIHPHTPEATPDPTSSLPLSLPIHHSPTHPREGPNVLSNALVRVVDLLARLERVIHAVGVVQLVVVVEMMMIEGVGWGGYVMSVEGCRTDERGH